MDFYYLPAFFTLLLMKTTFSGYKTDIAGLLWLAVALFFSLALGSYNPLDPSFNSVSTFVQVHNKCGYLGSFLADILFQFFGLGAWVFVFLALRQSVVAFQRTALPKEGMRNLVILALGLFVSSSLLELHQPGKSFFQGYIYSGGVLGRFVITSTEPYLHFAGHLLLFWSLALVLFILITKKSLSSLVVRLAFIMRDEGKRALFVLVFYAVRFSMKMRDFCLNKIEVIFSEWKRKRGWEGKGESSSNSFGILGVSKDGKTLEKDRAEDLFPTISDDKDYFFQDEEEPKEEQVLSNKYTVSTKEKVRWDLPTAQLLSAPSSPSFQLSSRESQEDAERLKKKLEQFSISGEITHIRSGPVITLFEFKPEDHIKVARITQMEDDLMIALKSKSIRIIAPIPGRDVVGIETAHTKRQMVYLKSLIDEPTFWQSTHALPLVLGRHVDGRSAIQDLRKIPHLMVAGSTGSGKSVFIVSFLLSLLFRHTPDSLRLLLVDPKRVDLSIFEGLPHLLADPVHESHEAVLALQWCLGEMNKRYRSLSQFQVRDIEAFNERVKHLEPEEIQSHKERMENTEEDYYIFPQPYICVVLEEFGDLMSSPDRGRIESAIVRLAQMARACGMHLILSMQSPRKDVVTGLIKTNIPGRISFKVSSRIDSRIILDEGGAERLLSQGDMLYLGPGQSRPERFHGPFVKEQEALSVIDFWRKQVTDKSAHFINFSSSHEKKGLLLNQEGRDREEEDQKYAEIFKYVSDLKEVSASHLQRKYGLGYPRAARLIDRLEEEGVIGPARGSKPREVLAQK